jgi:hypothetical protein
MISRLETCGAAALLILVSYLLVSINLRLRREVRAYKARQAAFPVSYLDTSKLALTPNRSATLGHSNNRHSTGHCRKALLSLARARVQCLGYFQDASEDSPSFR